MTVWHQVLISDKNDIEIFRNECSDMALDGVVRELQRHLDHIKQRSQAYNMCIEQSGVDVDSAHIKVNGERLQSMDEVLAELEMELEGL